MRHDTSESCVDALVEWGFRCLTTTDPDEIAQFVSGVLRIMEAEIRRVTHHEQRRLHVAAQTRSMN